MTMRPANIGLLVTALLLVSGLLLLGPDASDAEAQGAFAVALVGGWIAMMALVRRELRRPRR
jgi:hypothetical protein